MELREREQKHIDKSKKKIDDLLLNCDFEIAFENLIAFLISIEPKYVPYILAYYDNTMKQHHKTKQVFRVQDADPDTTAE